MVNSSSQNDAHAERVSERLQLATKAAGIGIWDWDVMKDELIWDDAMYRLFGIDKKDFSGAYDAWAKYLAPEDFERANAEVQAALRGEREFDTEFRIIWPDSSIHYIKADAQTFRDEKGDPLRMVGVNYDITERKLAEEQINLLHTITLDVAASRDLPSALEVVLRRICEKTGWALGQAWLPRQDGTGLDCCPAWFAAAASLEEFRSASRDITLLQGTGLPGRVWSSRQPAWVRDVTQDTNFPRAEAAKKSGLKAALGVPIISGDDVIAVLEFFLSERRDEDERLVKVISAVAAQIGLVCERKVAEEKVRHEQELAETTINSMPGVFYLFTNQGKYLRWNKNLERVTGYTHEEIAAMKPLDFIIPDEHQLITNRIQEVMDAGESTAEANLVTKDGHVTPYFFTGRRVVIDGEPCVIGMGIDITERERAEEALRASEERFFKAFNSSPIRMGIVRLRDGAILDVNDRWLLETGYAREEIIGRPAFELTMWLGEERQSRLRRILDEGKPLRDVEFRLVTKTGERRFTLVSAEAIDLDGEPCYLWASNDITERKRGEEALRESERRFSDTLTNIEMIAVMADMKGDITFCNDYLLRLTGWQREEAIGRNWYEMFLPEGEKARVTGLLTEVEPRGEITVHMENEIKTRSGDRRLVKWTNTTLRGPDGHVIGVAALGDDITEWKAAEQQLRSSTAQLRALSARLQSAREEEGTRIAREIHDELGSALTGLKWDLERIDKILAGTEDAEIIQSVQKKIPRMTRLIDDTIDTVRRISSELRPGVLDDLGFVAAIEWQAQQFEQRTGIRCVCVAAPDTIDLRQDGATTVFRVFQETLTNVLRHAHATRVDVKMSNKARWFELEVQDNGRGITEAEKSNTRSLGLLGMTERVHLIGGRIQIKGIPGKGTAVLISVPND